MIRLIYRSAATAAPTFGELERLLFTARTFNDDHGITGLLLYLPPEVSVEACFLQLVEGAGEDVDAVYRRIRSDSRHRDISVISRQEVTERAFPGWSMRLEYLSAEQLRRVAPQAPVRPHDLDGVAGLLADPGLVEALVLQHCG